MTTLATAQTPQRAAQDALLAALREVDTLHARRTAGEDVPEADVQEAYDSIDHARAALHALTPDLPRSTSLTARLTTTERNTPRTPSAA